MTATTEHSSLDPPSLRPAQASPAGDLPPSAELVLGPSVQASVETLLRSWAASPHSAQLPLTSARIEPAAVHLAASASQTVGEVVLRYSATSPWFSATFPNSWSEPAAAAFTTELAKAFSTNPWAAAGRPDAHAQTRAQDTAALATEALLGPPASVATVSQAYAAGMAALLLTLTLALSAWLLRSRPRRLRTKE